MGVTLAAGITHKRCQYPGLRVLGELKSPLFEQYEALRDFDFNRWIAAAKNGPSMLSNTVVQGTATVLWNSRLPGDPRGTWCVRVDASNGSSHYLSNRAKVLRFAQQDARAEAERFQYGLDEALAKGNPWCVSEDRQYFADRSLLLKKLPRGTPILECIRASAVLFNLSIDKAYSTTGEYYAPVVLLVTPERGTPIELSKSIVVLTDPFQILFFLQNWKEAGLQIPNISAEVIDTDARFDRVVSEAIGMKRGVLADPLFNREGSLLNGIHLIVNPDSQ